MSSHERWRKLGRAMAKLSGPGRLPLPKNLIDKTPEELVRTLARFGIKPDIEQIAQNAERAYSRLAKAVNQGVEPDEAMWKSLEEQHEREMTQALRQLTKQAIRDYRVEQLSDADKLMWLTVGGSNVCPSCEKRHGKIKTLKQWIALGMPGSGALICQDECRCHLIPA